jgi:acyl dehydratase
VPDPIELESPPSLGPLYARALALPLVPGGGDELPDREVRAERAELDPERVADYSRVCGFPLRDTVPATYPHVLAFPLQMRLMTERDFPFSVLGLVHIANRIEVSEPIPAGEELAISVRAEDLRPHRSGRQFDLVSEGRIDGRAVWRGRSNYLRRGGDGEKAAHDGAAGGGADDSGAGGKAEAPDATWRVPGDIGRRYAEVSGDRNPIHMHSLTARLLGQPRAIAHGMWTKARCLSSFDGRLPEAFAIEIEFRSPLRVPATVSFGSARLERGYGFEVASRDGERSHAAGSITWAE